MKRKQLLSILAGPHLTERGFSLVEIIFASAAFAIFASTFGISILVAQQGDQEAGLRNRALLISEEGLEATRSIRDEDFSLLTNGTHGLVRSSNTWILSGASDLTDMFTREVIISSIDNDTKSIESRATYAPRPQETRTLSLVTRLSNWHTPGTQAQMVSINTTNASLSGDNKELRNIALTSTSGSALAITHITVSWQNTKKIERLRIEDTTVWSKTGPGTPTGTQDSGTQLNVQDYILEAGKTDEIDNIKFTGNMSGEIFTITLLFADGSSKTFSVF